MSAAPTIQLTGISARQDALRLRRQAALAADARRFATAAEMAYGAGLPVPRSFVPTIRLLQPPAQPAIKKPSIARPPASK